MNLCRMKQNTKSKNDLVFVYVFILLLITVYILFYGCVVPFVDDLLWIWINKIQTMIMIVMFMIVCLKDPGYIDNKNQSNLLELLVDNEPNKICAYCQIIKPIRSKHCHFCQKCVIVYDHHCPWVKNCIGAKNHLHFILFIINIWFSLVFMMCFIIFRNIFIQIQRHI